MVSVKSPHCSNPPPPCNEAIHIRVLYNLNEGEKNKIVRYTYSRKKKLKDQNEPEQFSNQLSEINSFLRDEVKGQLSAIPAMTNRKKKKITLEEGKRKDGGNKPLILRVDDLHGKLLGSDLGLAELQCL
jgi:hypothetical protein